MSGADVTVYERDANQNARQQGATLDLHQESGLRALEQAGLTEAFKANYRPGAEKLRIMNKTAGMVLDEHLKPRQENLRPEIDRGPLQQILLDSLRAGTVIWGSHFETLTPQNGSWKLTFKSGASAMADLVIAADGANSKLRPYITPVKPYYYGITVLEGVIYASATASPKIHRLLKGGKIFALGDEKSLVVSSKGDGSLVFYTGCKTPEYWSRESGIDFSDKAQVLNWFKTEYAGWDMVWQELFENAAMPFVVRPQYCMPPGQTWQTLPNITMLGDAAHLMPPFAGEGVNMAMLDALELSNCLTGDKFPEVYSAIAAFEKQMCKRASEAANESLYAAEELHSANAIAFIMAVLGNDF